MYGMPSKLPCVFADGIRPWIYSSNCTYMNVMGRPRTLRRSAAILVAALATLHELSSPSASLSNSFMLGQ